MKNGQKYSMEKNHKTISGFSKLSREQKIGMLALTTEEEKIFYDAIVENVDIKGVVDDLSENTISHFPFPFGIAPNFVVNNQSYFLPLVTRKARL